MIIQKNMFTYALLFICFLFVGCQEENKPVKEAEAKTNTKPL